MFVCPKAKPKIFRKNYIKSAPIKNIMSCNRFIAETASPNGPIPCNLYCTIKYPRPPTCNTVLTRCSWGLSIAKWSFFLKKKDGSWWAKKQLRTTSLTILADKNYLYLVVTIARQKFLRLKFNNVSKVHQDFSAKNPFHRVARNQAHDIHIDSRKQ